MSISNQPSSPSSPSGSAQSAPEVYEDPRDPSRLISLSYFLTTIGAGFLLANNWKRLGKPEWAQRTLMLSIAAGVTALIVEIGTIVLVLGSPNERNIVNLMFPGIGLGFGINFGCMSAIWYLQSGPYRKWKKQGREAMLAHEYKLQTAWLIFGGFVNGGNRTVLSVCRDDRTALLIQALKPILL